MVEESFAADALAMADIGAYEWEAKTGNVKATRSMFKIWGIDPATIEFSSQGVIEPGAASQVYDLAGGTFGELMRRVHEDDLPKIKAAADAFLASPDVVVTDYRMLTPDGRTLHLRRHARLVRDEKGAPVRILALVQDIGAQLDEAIGKRMVAYLARDLVSGTSPALREQGRALARSAGTADIEPLLAAFARLGFGRLDLADASPTRATFRGKDLAGVEKGSRGASCQFVLGFAEGAFSAVRRAEVLGAETHCRRRGDASCEFVVAVR